ncbi:MAG: efflux RND transporter permease subunit [Elusimicrobia bacterium]|nr:efflux RND transporter permease subunit [Elusimicrobiota bacterium]
MSSSQLWHLALFGLLMVLLSRRLPRFAMERPVTLGMILLGVLIFGVAALVKLPVELMPNVAYGNVTVFIDVRGGMPPPEVERLVTKPVEEGMGTVSHLRNLISSSKKDRSIVTLEFEPGIDMDLAALEVREKFLRVKPKLPPEIEKPIIARYEESDAPVVIAALTSEKFTPEELRHLVDTDVKEKLLRVDGVANVEVGGGRERKIVVDIDRDKLAAVGLPIKKVVGVLEQNNLNLKMGEVAGAPTLLLGVRTVGAFRALEDIQNMALAVSKNGGRVRLKDIAEVKDSYLEQESYSRLNAKAAVTIYVQKETTANTVRVASQVQKEIDRFRARLPAGVELVTISNQKAAILAAIESVNITLLYGMALVILVLPLFLAKTRFTRTVVAALLFGLIGNVLLFYVMRWNLNATAWPVALLTLGVMALAFARPDLRMALVVALSIPASVLVTLAFMYIENISINVMSLSGLILGIGLLVDNAVVVMENYDRIVGENPQMPLRKAMLQAADEMVSSIVGGTLTTVVVFLPFSLLAKQTQILFAGISFAVTASLFSSLFVALSVVPALGALINPLKIRHTSWDDWLQARQEDVLKWLKRKGWTWKNLLSRLEILKPWLVWLLAGSAAALLLLLHFVLKAPWQAGAYVLAAGALIGLGLVRLRRYPDNLRWSLSNRKRVFLAVGAVFAAALAVLIFVLPKDFMASSEQSEFVVFVELDTGVRLDISNQIVQEVEKAVRDYGPTKDAIKNISSKVEGWSSKVYVTLKDLSERSMSTQEVINTLRPEVDKTVEKYAEDYKAFSYFSEPRSGKEIFVEIFGYEYDLMAKIAMEIAGRVGKVPGLSDVKIRYRPGRPQLSVAVDPMRAALFGLDTKEIAESLHAQMRGLRATTFYDKAQEVETVVRVRPEQRETVAQMKNLLIATSAGEQVPVLHVAEIKSDLSPSEVWHRNRSRMIQVSANLGATSLETAAKLLKESLKSVSFPPEYYWDIGGQYEDMIQANRDFWKAMVLTIFLVFLVMACQFESYSRPLIIMGAVPLSAIGAMAALSAFGATVTLGVSVGLLMLGGIVVNNGIMLIDRINILRESDPQMSWPDLLVQAGTQRIRPIFMTTCTTVLGLVPMALDRSESAVLWAPLAITVIGGLVSSTILTLFVVPCLYLSMLSFQERLKILYWPTALKAWGRLKSKTLRAAKTSVGWLQARESARPAR